MKKASKLKILIILPIILLAVFYFGKSAKATVTLPWSTTFNCSDWTEGDTLSCDGLEVFGGWYMIPAGIATGGSTTTLIDTSVNFIADGPIQVGDLVYILELGVTAAPIKSITTTTNPNDTLVFNASDLGGTVQSGYRYFISHGTYGRYPGLEKSTTISATSNNPSGSGGKGIRDYIGDGSNIGSGNLGINFNSAQTELWVRWYIKYATGFKWWPDINHDKWFYIRTDGPNDAIPVLSTWGALEIGPGGGSPSNPVIAWFGWDDWMVNGSLVDGHRTSDGQWHFFEFHLKMDTNCTGVGSDPHGDGIGQIWVDGVLKADDHTVCYSYNDATSRLGWTSVQIKSNQSDPHNGLLGSYVDIDDVAINNTGYIGPVSQADTTPPAPPTGVTIS